MRVTAGGTRLISNMRTGMVASGKRYTRPSGLLPTPNIVWKGNPFCPPGTVLYLPGMPGSGAKSYDYSGLKNDGDITGATWTQLPSGLWVLTYDGDDLVSIPHAASLNLGSSLTLIAWINHTSGPYRTILSKRAGPLGGAACAYQLYVNSTTKLGFYSLASGEINSGLAINSGSWDFTAVTINGTALNFYLNDLTASATITAPVDNTADLVLGRAGAYLNEYLVGIEGEIWVCDRPLPALDITRTRLTTKWRYI